MAQSFKSLNRTQRFSFLAHFVLAVGSFFLFSSALSSSASAVSINSATVHTTFDIQWEQGQNGCDWTSSDTSNCHTWYRNGLVLPDPSTLPFTLVAWNSQRSRTTLYALVADFTPSPGNTTRYYNKYRFGLTLRQNVPSGQVFTLKEDLGRYEVSMQGVTSDGNLVTSSTCGYEIAEDNFYISHICYIDLDSYKTLSSATFILGSHAADGASDDIGYVSKNYVYNIIGNTNDLRFTDITSVVQSSDDPMLSGQQEILNNVKIINSNIVDFANQNHEDLQALRSAVNDLSSQQHSDYEDEVAREEAKEEELENQAGDLGLSAQNPGNPFASLFNASGCVDMPTVGGWFGNPNLRVCSPYPSTIRFIFDFVGSAIILGFLLRIYIKHLNGGFNT